MLRITSPVNEPAADVIARPSQSLLRTPLPDDPRAIRHLHAFVLPRVIAYGRFQRTPVVQNTARLETVAREALFDGLAGTISVSEAARRITALKTTSATLRRGWKPVAQTVDVWIFDHLFREDGYLEWYSQAFAETFPEAEIDSLRSELRRGRELVALPTPTESIRESAVEITDKYGLAVLESAVQVAFAPTELVVPQEIEDSTLWSSAVEQTTDIIDIQSRFERLADRLLSIAPDFSASDSADRRSRMHDWLDESPTFRPDPSREEQAILSPLLERPFVSDSPTEGAGLDRVLGTDRTPTVGQLILRCFAQGGFGGIVYETTDQSNWLVNPFVASQTPKAGEQPYQARWQQAYLGTALIEALEERVTTDGDIAPIDCPLCVVSRFSCRGERCGCSKTMATVNEQRQALAQEFVQARE